MRYNPSALFIRSGFLVSYRIRSAMKFSQNVLHYIWHTSRVYVIHIKSLSRYFQITQNWTDKAKWRSIEASNNVNKHAGYGLLAVLNKLAPPRIKFALVKFNSTDGSTWQFVHSGGGSHGAVLNSTGYVANEWRFICDLIIFVLLPGVRFKCTTICQKRWRHDTIGHNDIVTSMTCHVSFPFRFQWFQAERKM